MPEKHQPLCRKTQSGSCHHAPQTVPDCKTRFSAEQAHILKTAANLQSLPLQIAKILVLDRILPPKILVLGSIFAENGGYPPTQNGDILRFQHAKKILVIRLYC